jgi:hypothetical protein
MEWQIKTWELSEIEAILKFVRSFPWAQIKEAF